MRISAMFCTAKGMKTVMGTRIAWYMAMVTKTRSGVMAPPVRPTVRNVRSRMNLTEKKLGARIRACR